MSDTPRVAGGNSKKKREKEEEEMTFGLLECLRAVGLQHHYATFISVGIHQAAHLSILTMEDYPILGIHCMEDRTRLYQLIQMVKTLDLKSLEHEGGDDDVYSAEAGRNLAYDDCEAPEEHRYDCDHDDDDRNCAVARNLNTGSFSKSSRVSRRLDFSDEYTHSHHEHLFHSSHDESSPGKGPVTNVQLDCNTESSSVCKGNNNHKLDTHPLHPDFNMGANIKSDVTSGINMENSPIRFSPQYVSFHKPKPKPGSLSSKKFRDKLDGHRNRGSFSREEKIFTDISCDRAFEHMCEQIPVYELKGAAGYNYGLPLSPPSLPDKKRSGGQRISVCVRKRPQTHVECRRGEADVVTTPSRECVIVHESKEAVDLTQFILQHTYFFDQVFGEESSNEEVYQRTTYPLVQHMLNGGKATCFAYGQTGSGKTHTMLGSPPRSPGLYALAVQDIFAHLSSTPNLPLLVYVSFFEIYCGQLYDLLDHRKRLYAREDGQKVVHIAGLRDIRVDSVSSLLEVIAQGTEERTQGVSGVNPHSSRSHALLQIQLRDTNQQLAGRIWFVDLAGSERASDTKEPDRQSRMEGAEINQSLLALKECIRSLDQEQLHTPFRQSKLTQVLKDSFVGDSMTCMIANISPGHLASEHTLNTLRYADRVKELQGQGGLKGGRRGKTIPKRSMSKSNSNNRRSSSNSQGDNVFIRGKSPPKKPKCGIHREAFIPMLPTTIRLATGGPILCSTPKNCKQDVKTSTRNREAISVEQITPIRSAMRTGDNRRITVEREGGKSKRDVEMDNASSSAVDHDIRESEFFCKEWENQPRKGKEEDRRKIENQHTQSSRDSSSGLESGNEDLQIENKRDKEKEMHLRRYHQQLQHSTPSSSSLPVFSASTCLSESVSHPAFLSSPVSSASCLSSQHSPRLLDSALTHQGLEELLDVYKATVNVRAVDPETSQHSNESKNKVGHDDSGGRDVRSSREECRPMGLRGMRGGRWAWVAGSMTGARPTVRETQVSYNCESEQKRKVGEGGTEPSDVPAEGVWSNEEHESNDSCSYFNRPAVESSNHRAPAERPLSPGREHTNTSLTSNELSELPFRSNHTRYTSRNLHSSSQSSMMGEPSSSKEDPLFAADANKRELSNAVLPSEDSFNNSMDPLSISLLEVEQQAATSSFLQGYLKSSPPCPLDNEIRECSWRGKEHVVCLDRTVKDEEEDEFGLSLLKIPQVETHYHQISNLVTSSTTERRQDKCCTKKEQLGWGNTKLPIQEALLGSLQDQKINPKHPTSLFTNKTSASPLKLSSCALSKQTPIIKPNLSSAQPCKNKGSPNSYNVNKNIGTQISPQHMHNKHPPSFSLSPAKAVVAQMKTLTKQDATVHPNPSDSSNISPNNWTTSKFYGDTSNQTTRNIINPPTTEDLDNAKWHVIQAHWKQLEDMEALWQKEGTLLCQQPDMAFSEYIHKLEEIMKRKAQCVHSMIAQLQPYLETHHSHQRHKHNQK